MPLAVRRFTAGPRWAGEGRRLCGADGREGHVPALVVHGEEDVALEPERSDSLVAELDARREMVSDAGHSSNLENPEPVNEAIRAFLGDVY
ncbi:alpha/beta fold hydrolase [Natronomonas marina]|uniref:alpha/beta fold hydrolase n=1 Tax=Natronomonas marina TaxID=2961939 RepID=UPI0020C950B1|nr:alpha/beta hydrolase [Natronomonas marina]